MKPMIRKFLSVPFLMAYLWANIISPAAAFQWIRLSDQELDRICVGGFDFDLNAAYAFRSAALSQLNITAVDNLGANKIHINALNNGLVINRGDSAVASQANISVVFSQYGDIIDTLIKNVNLASVSNIFTERGGASVTGMVLKYTESNSGPLAESGALPAAEAAAPSAAAGTPADTYTMTLNEITSSASAAVAQTNIAAVIASQGNIKNVEVSNINMANVQNVGNAAVAAQTNIALVIAGGAIENSHVQNANQADVTNVVTTQVGGASVTPVSLEGAFGKIFVNQVAVQQAAEVVQTNITFVRSGMNDLKSKLHSNIQNALSQNKLFSFR